MLRVALGMLAAEGVAGFTTRKVAQEADTSPPAVYELFGDKAGLVRELFFEGFRMLRRRLDRLAATDDARADLVAVIETMRGFIRKNPVLSQVMFSRPFADFDPGPSDVEAGAAVRQFVVERVRRCTAARLLAGDETDIAHVLVSMTQGLAATEVAGWLGSSRASVDRRWDVAIRAVLDGLQPAKRPAARGGAGVASVRVVGRRRNHESPAREIPAPRG